jgi:cytochrome P450
MPARRPLPESFDLLDPAVIEDPYALFASLREHAPVWEIPGTRVWMVSSWALVDEALERVDDFSAHLTGLLVTGPDGRPQLFDLTHLGPAIHAIATADDPEHALHRRLVQPLLSLARVGLLDKELRGWTEQRLAPLLEAGGGEFTAAVANPIPTLAMARVLGLPPEDFAQLLGWGMSGGEILAGTHGLERMAQLSADTAALNAYLHEQLARALDDPQRAPDTDVLGALAHAVRSGALDPEHARGVLVVLVGAASESTAGLLGSAVRLLATRPDLQRELRAQPGLIPAFVEEVMRLEPPFKGHYRVVRRATRLGGVDLPAGGRLMLMWAAANRDPREFERPDELDLRRPAARHHLGFGRGIHFCVGAPLARLEARVVLEELLARTRSVALDPARPPVHARSIFVRRLAHLELQLQTVARH